MYFPYLRCKQFELLAIREMAIKIGEEKTISPILEPVKKSTGTLEKTLDSLIGNTINFTLIINPAHGEFVSDISDLVDMINSNLSKYDNFQIGIIINQFTNLEYITAQLKRLKLIRSLALIHSGRINDIEALAEWSADYRIKYNYYGENFPVRRYRGIITPDTKVLLDDKFRPQVKNADYLNTPDEFFSDEYLYYREDSFIGFGDYLTIGDDYTETGWLPYAVAIHLTYKKEGGEIWIKHFVSDSNSDTTDVAGKFGEALLKLVIFLDEKNIQTEAANEFRVLQENGHYPGLGSIKKLSIKNHLELLHDLLHIE